MNSSNSKIENRHSTILTAHLLEKYSVTIPRYTSYPTAPEWTESFTKEDLARANDLGNKNKSPVSLYFHLPFCENQCYFCACNVVISKKKSVVSAYLEHIKKEIQLKVGAIHELPLQIDKGRPVQQIHLGGGTPTYFSPDELCDFFSTVKENFNISKNCEVSIEVDPRVTTYEHMETLSKLGFNRLSMGIQDFNPKVQEAINRVQPYEETEKIFSYAREFGFESINVDLIYGLPFQTKDTFQKTIELIKKLNPDRIALFHYAHLPQLLAHQAKYIREDALPDSYEKTEILQSAVHALIKNGFVFIGLDHFAKPEDELAITKKNKSLHRNFQGYTTKAGCDLYGFGITAISNVQNTFSQNIKKINPYYESLDKDEIPLYRGIVLNNDDILRREIIMKILCDGEVNKEEIEEKYGVDFDKYFSCEIERLKELENDGLVETNKNMICVTNTGQYFLRNIASVFDFYLQKKNGKQKIYSKSI